MPNEQEEEKRDESRGGRNETLKSLQFIRETSP